MNKNKLISFALIGLLSLSLVSCGDKSNKQNNSNSDKVEMTGEVFENIPEQNLVTDYLKENLKGGDELFKDGISFKKLYWDDVMDKGLISKYNLSYEENTVYDIKDVSTKYPELYCIAINAIIASGNENEKDAAFFANKTLMPYVQNYLSDVWENDKDGEYKLAPEFEKLNPKKEFENYLKRNKIEITNIVYPTTANGLQKIAGSTVMNVPVIVEGYQNEERFSRKVNLDFFFTVSQDIRKGEQYDSKDKNFEIMGVNISSDKKDLNGYNYHFDYENSIKDYGIDK